MSARDLLDLIWIVPALPLFGAVVLLLFGKRIGEPFAGWFATAMVGLSFAASLVMFFARLDLPGEVRVNIISLYTWLPAGALHVDMGFYADTLSVTWILLITGVGSLIHLYSIGYMHGDQRFSRFFAYLNLFVFSMLMLVLGSSFLVTFLGWEGVGLCSYLLISFWFERIPAAVAGKKAFVTNRVGDVGFLLAMFLIFVSYGSLNYAAIPAGAHAISGGTVTAIALLLLLAAVGKSAQIPLHLWLPDAMEGPTPVSALIHAATMVTAGVFLLCRAHVFLDLSSDAMTVVAWVGGTTALLAGTVAILQPDIKRVLAYSTVSQLGFMFLAVGIGAYSAAVFMVLCHAFYKGCLFLGAGSVIHGNGDVQDMRVMGRFRKFMPYTAGAMVVAWLAIAGVPPLSGFFSKDEIISQAYLREDYGLWVIGIVAAGFTAVYMTRLIWLTFYGNARYEATSPAIANLPVVAGGSGEDRVDDDPQAHGRAGVAEDPEGDPTPTVAYGDPVPEPVGHAPHESPPIMTFPIMLLAVLAAVGGIMNLPFTSMEWLDKWLESSFRGVPEVHPDSFIGGLGLELLTLVIALAGIGLAYTLYKVGLERADRDPLDEKLGGLAPVLGHAYYYDAGISKLVGGPGRALAGWLDRVVDNKIIDGAVNGVGSLFALLSRGVQQVQDGRVRRYALGIAVGAGAGLLYVVIWLGR
ncbi:MAG TPA: NADH-quinone oxidoreductase subunit L [Acidimicrobiia bacterium]|nr:NADH-quinone oxidoreductase subunit L [Acidimicrobiia bacterium]